MGKDTETWKPVPSEPGMLASSWGRVLQPPRYAPVPNGGYRLYTPRPTYGQKSRASKAAQHSYRIVMVYREGPRRQSPRKVHQLVCEAFYGPRPDGMVTIHLDEDSHNNRPENLRWGTQKENLNMPGFIEYCRGRGVKMDQASSSGDEERGGIRAQ